MKKQAAQTPKGSQAVSIPLPTQNSQIEAEDPGTNATKAKNNDGGYIWIV